MSSGRVLRLCQKHIAEIPGLAILPKQTSSNSKESAKVDEEIALLTEELAKISGKKSLNMKKKFQRVGFMVGGAQVGYKKVSKKNLFAKEDMKGKPGNNADESSPGKEKNDANEGNVVNQSNRRKSQVCVLM